MYLTAVIDWFTGTCSRGGCRTRWRGSSAWKPSTRRCRWAGQRSSTPTRVRSSRRGLHQPLGGGRDRGEPGRSGRALDNVFVERLWRSVKYEYI